MSFQLPVFLSRLAPLALLAACSAEGTIPSGTPDPLAQEISTELRNIATISPLAATVGFQLTEPLFASPKGDVDLASCDLAEAGLQRACATIVGTSQTIGCWGQTTFFWAHDVPRCAGRVELYDNDRPTNLTTVLSFDLTGAPRAGGGEGCGDGVLDPGEQCDDGNHELWDGCDQSCMNEEFNGCETVIEQKFQAAQVAWIDRAAWSSPRSHLMVHDRATAISAVDATTCSAALTAGQDSCNQLQQDMPFVSWCSPQAQFGVDGVGAFCAVRLTVGFQRVDPNHGVFTTSLYGVLAFTIR